MFQAKHTRSCRVVLFGGQGFIGKYLVDVLSGRGHKVRVPFDGIRKNTDDMFQRPGVEFFECSLDEPASLEKAILDADAVVNLIGLLHPSKARGFEQSHIHWPRAIAAAAQEIFARTNKPLHLVHISALGAKEGVESKYLTSKYEGERNIATYPHHTVIRPSIVYGGDCAFARQMRGILNFLPVLWLPVGSAVVQPIMVEDIRDLILHVLREPQNFQGKTLSVAGPEVMTMRKLVALIARYELGKGRIVVPMGKKMSFVTAGLLEKLKDKPPLTRDDCVGAYEAPVLSPEENDAHKIVGPLITMNEQFHLRRAEGNLQSFADVQVPGDKEK